MDSSNQSLKPKPFAWVAEAMPLLPGRIRELRAQFGNQHVNECWRRGVVGNEPGWFFARQGPVTIGAPFVGDPALSDFAAQQVAPGACLVVIRPAAPAEGSTHGG